MARFPAAVMSTGISGKASMKPTMDQKRKADSDAIYAETLYGNVQKAQEGRAKTISALPPIAPQRGAAAAAAPGVYPMEAAADASGRIARGRRDIAQEATGDAANAGRMLQRATEARSVGVAPSQLAQHQMQQQGQQQALATQAAQTNLVNQQANVLIPAQAVEARQSGLGKMLDPVASVVGKGLDAYGAYQSRRMQADSNKYEVDQETAAKKYASDRNAAASMSRGRDYLDPTVQAQVQGIDLQIKSMEPHLYGDDESPNPDAWNRMNGLIDQRQGLLVPPSSMVNTASPGVGPAGAPAAPAAPANTPSPGVSSAAPAPTAVAGGGTTATNPRTGEKLQWDGQSWVPVTQ